MNDMYITTGLPSLLAFLETINLYRRPTISPEDAPERFLRISSIHDQYRHIGNGRGIQSPIAKNDSDTSSVANLHHSGRAAIDEQLAALKLLFVDDAG